MATKNGERVKLYEEYLTKELHQIDTDRQTAYNMLAENYEKELNDINNRINVIRREKDKLWQDVIEQYKPRYAEFEKKKFTNLAMLIEGKTDLVRLIKQT